jgi:multimeric flavodoxin WrbA
MHVMAFNGSPRKTWNTGTLLAKALEGAAAAGAKVELTHLYDLRFQGCTSCLTCKRKSMRDDRRCACQDALTPLLEKARQADAIICGSPVYFYGETGVFRSFMERLLFPWLSYDAEVSNYTPRRIPTALIYTMNLPADQAWHPRPDCPPELVLRCPETTRCFFERIMGSCECLFSYDTLQVDDYDTYSMSRFNAREKQRGRRDVFPEDCRKAAELGERLVRLAQANQD